MDSQTKHDNKPAREDTSKRTGSFNARKALVVGLTGGIASGKTTIGQMLEELGAKTISADKVVHGLMEPESDIWREIVAEFGEEILSPNGKIDRKRLGDIVFKNPERRRRLEEIIHPRVICYLEQEADRFRREGSGILVLEIPLLIETSSENIVDKVLVISAEQETQIGRLNNRYGIGREEALRRINSQLPMSEKIKHADWVISTDESLENTRQQLLRVWSELQKSLAQP